MRNTLVMARLHNTQYACYGQCCVMRNTLYACYDMATQCTIRMLWPGPHNTQYTIHMLWPGLHNTQYTCYCQACAIHSIRGDTIPTTMSPPSGRHVAWSVSHWRFFGHFWRHSLRVVSQKGINMCSLKWSKAEQEKTWSQLTAHI